MLDHEVMDVSVRDEKGNELINLTGLSNSDFYIEQTDGIYMLSITHKTVLDKLEDIDSGKFVKILINCYSEENKKQAKVSYEFNKLILSNSIPSIKKSFRILPDGGLNLIGKMLTVK